jgi:hypothetical protein
MGTYPVPELVEATANSNEVRVDTTCDNLSKKEETENIEYSKPQSFA